MSRCPAFVVLCVALPAAAALAHGCAGGDKLELGPKPAAYSGQMAGESQTVDDMRAWLQSLTPEQAKTLEETGEIVLRYADLKASDPTHAQIVAKYAKALEARLAQKMQARGMPAPLFSVETVSFVRVTHDARRRPARGAYEFRIEFADGSFSNLQLSDPL
jgi:hypothetical protein